MSEMEGIGVNNPASSPDAENFEDDTNDVKPDSSTGDDPQNKSEELLYNRQRELDRKLEKANALMEELNRQKTEFQQAQAKNNYNEDEFLGYVANQVGILDEKGKPDTVSTKKLISLIDLVTDKKFSPKLNKIEETMTIKDYNDYEVYKDEIQKIMNNELQNVSLPVKQKFKMAYEMAKGRNPQTSNQSNVTLSRPNMATSSVGTKQNQKSVLSKEEIAHYTEYAEQNNIPVKRIIERAKKLKQGYRGA